jgi:hypothetical protein
MDLKPFFIVSFEIMVTSASYYFVLQNKCFFNYPFSLFSSPQEDDQEEIVETITADDHTL